MWAGDFVRHLYHTAIGDDEGHDNNVERRHDTVDENSSRESEKEIKKIPLSVSAGKIPGEIPKLAVWKSWQAYGLRKCTSKQRMELGKRMTTAVRSWHVERRQRLLFKRFDKRSSGHVHLKDFVSIMNELFDDVDDSTLTKAFAGIDVRRLRRVTERQFIDLCELVVAPRIRTLSPKKQANFWIDTLAQVGNVQFAIESIDAVAANTLDAREPAASSCAYSVREMPTATPRLAPINSVRLKPPSISAS